MPGKLEAEALRYMHEWEPSLRVSSMHIVAQQVGTGLFRAFAWSPQRKVWRLWDAGPQNAVRRIIVDAMLTQIEWADLTIMDEPIDLADYDGLTTAEFDHCVFCDRHTMLCPDGAPGSRSGWATVEMNGSEVGQPLSSGATVSGGSFFHEQALRKEFRRTALPVENAPLGCDRPVRVSPVLVRHERAAREVVSKDGWGVTGRPDLLARSVDRELAIKAAFEAEQHRRTKAGEYQPPSEQLWNEIAIRMDREWAAAMA